MTHQKIETVKSGRITRIKQDPEPIVFRIDDPSDEWQPVEVTIHPGSPYHYVGGAKFTTAQLLALLSSTEISHAVICSATDEAIRRTPDA